MERPSDAAEQIEEAAEEATENPWFARVARLGFVVSGLLHMIVGGISWQVVRGTSGEADRSGALRGVASVPSGNLLLWAGGVALLALAAWMLLDAWVRAHHAPGILAGAGRAVRPAGRAVVYAVLGVTVLRFATGGGGDSAQQSVDLTAGLMAAPFGRVLVGLVGLVVVLIDGAYGFIGIARRFRRQLGPIGNHRISIAVSITGVIGYTAKGVALGAVGLLFGWSAITADPGEAAGLDGALSVMAQLPAGTALLLATGAGWAVFGLYCLMRARYAAM